MKKKNVICKKKKIKQKKYKIQSNKIFFKKKWKKNYKISWKDK